MASVIVQGPRPVETPTPRRASGLEWDPIAEFRAFAAGGSGQLVSREQARAVVAHIDSLIEGIAMRERMLDETVDDLVAAIGKVALDRR